MVFINEWLPNPIGVDAKGEFIELYNDSDAAASLNGWRLKTSGKKSFSLSGRVIDADSYLVLSRSLTKLALKNMDEEIFLSDAHGDIVDQSSFQGTAQEGKSLSRVDYGIGPADHFAWADPTPGAKNSFAMNVQIAADPHPLNTPLNQGSLGGAAAIGIMLCFGVAFAGVMLYSVRNNDELSELFFGCDEAIR